MGSTVWTDEESQYIKAMLNWKERPDFLDSARSSRVLLGSAPETALSPPVGEFRILVIGAKGVGKTSIITRFCTGSLPRKPDSFYEGGCRHPVELDEQVYTADVLELPTKHLPSNPLLEQAIAITEAAVLVYAVDDPASFRMCIGLAEFIRNSVGASARGYGLLLLGNKCDVDDEDRRVRWVEGSKAAAAVTSGVGGPRGSVGGPGLRCSFMEASAEGGENIRAIFPLLGREVLKLRWINQQRREQAERRLRLASGMVQTAPATPTAKRRLGIWKTLTTPFFRR